MRSQTKHSHYGIHAVLENYTAHHITSPVDQQNSTGLDKINDSQRVYSTTTNMLHTSKHTKM